MQILGPNPRPTGSEFGKWVQESVLQKDPQEILSLEYNRKVTIMKVIFNFKMFIFPSKIFIKKLTNKVEMPFYLFLGMFSFLCLFRGGH